MWMTKWMKTNRSAYPFLLLPFIIALLTGKSCIGVLSTYPRRHHQCFEFGRSSLFLEPRVQIFLLDRCHFSRRMNRHISLDHPTHEDERSGSIASQARQGSTPRLGTPKTPYREYLREHI